MGLGQTQRVRWGKRVKKMLPVYRRHVGSLWRVTSQFRKNWRINMAVITFCYFSYYHLSSFMMEPRCARLVGFNSLSEPSFWHRMCNKRLFPVCCRYLGNTLYSAGPISDSPIHRENMSAGPGITPKHHFQAHMVSYVVWSSQVTLIQLFSTVCQRDSS